MAKKQAKRKVKWYNIAAPIITPAVALAIALPLTLKKPGVTKTYTIHFETNGGSTVSDQIVADGDKVIQPSTTWENHTFVGWYKDTTLLEEYDFNLPVYKDTTLYAKWADAPYVTYKCTFEDCWKDGSTTTESVVLSGEKAVMPLPTHHDDYGFKGWKTVKDDETKPYFDFMNTPITSDMKFYGYWTEKNPSAQAKWFATEETEKGTFVRFSDDYWTEGQDTDDIVVPSKIEGKTIVGICEGGLGVCSAHSISLPDSIQYFGSYSFGSCAHLRILNMPKQLKAIGARCFNDCYKLADLIFPEGLETIGDEAFLGSEDEAGSPDSYIRSIKMPSTLKYIGKSAFKFNAVQILDLSSCKDLELAENAFEYAINLKQITLPSNLKYIPAECFYMCPRIRDLTIPKTVKYIDNSAFYSCYRLRNLQFEEGSSLFSIGKYSFYNCYSLDSIIFPETLKSIQTGAFEECHTLSSVTFKKIQKWDVGGMFPKEDPFIPSATNLKENAEHLKEYTGSMFFSYLTIQADESGDVKYLTNNEDKCVIVGLSQQGSVKSTITIPAKITTANPITNQNQDFDVIGIASYAFADNTTVTKVEFEADSATQAPNLQYILDNAFSGCANLATINLEDCKQLGYIDDYAFKGCFLKESPIEFISFNLSLLPNLTYIGREAFEGVASQETNDAVSIIQSVKLPTAITYLGAGAFNGLANLSTLNFDGCTKLTSIGKYRDMEELEDIPLISSSRVTTINLENTGLTYLPRCVFANATQLNTIKLPAGLLEIYSNAFQGCTSLKEIKIPDNCYWISQLAFQDCTLTRVTLETDSNWNLYNGTEVTSYTAGTAEANATQFNNNQNSTWIKQLI